MEIEDKEILSKFETMPDETTLFLSVVRYTNGSWMTGPSADNKPDLIKALQLWNGVDAARIYRVIVPAKPMPAA